MIQTKHSTSILTGPDYTQSNPYQRLLGQELLKHGFTVRFAPDQSSLFPFTHLTKTQSLNLIHLHWDEAYISGRTLGEFLQHGVCFVTDMAYIRYIRKLPIVWTLHNIEAHERRFPRLHRLFRICLARIVSGIIVHSDISREQVIKHFFAKRSRTVVIPHAHYRDAYPAATHQDIVSFRQSLGIDVAAKLFLFFGRFRTYKGIEKLIRAWNEAQFSGSHLLLMGEVQDNEVYTAAQELAAKNRTVTLRPGFVPAELVAACFGAADIVVFSFERITTSGSVMLARSFGRVSIVPQLGDFETEKQSEGYILYDPQAQDSLVAALRKASKIPSQRTVPASLPSWPDSAEQHLQIYKRLLKKSF